MMMGEVKSYYFSFPRDFLVELKTSGRVGSGELFTLASTYLPGAVLEVSPARAPDIVVEQVESGKRGLHIGQRGVKIFDRWGDKVSLDIWHLLYSIVRVNYLSHDLYSVHSACGGRDQYVLIVGHSGVGKTSVLLRLVNDFGYLVYAGNKTVVGIESGKIRAEAGTKAISLRDQDLQRLPDLVLDPIAYSDRKAFFVDAKHYSREGSVPIGAIAVVRLSDQFVEASELPFPSSLHRLYPYFLDTVNADTVLCGGEAVYAGVLPGGTQDKLAKNLKEAVKQVKVVEISGSSGFVAEQISRL